VKLTDIGGRFTAFRERRGVWFAIVAGRIGWGTTFAGAVRDAMRGAVS
jgi:hypothetical protein